MLEGLSLRHRISSWNYWLVYAVLLAWFLASGFRILNTSFWSPIALMMALDWLMTRDTQLRYLLAAMLMLAIFSLFLIDVVSDAPIEDRPYVQTLAVLAALVTYQVLLWRVVLRKQAVRTAGEQPDAADKRRPGF